MLTNLQSEQFEEIFEELGKNLDITQSQYNAAVRSYTAVGEYLARHESPLGKFNLEILPQGSFMLGTMVQPILEDDELDIDLVCQLSDKAAHWTQSDLKGLVGQQLRSHGTYRDMIKDPEGRRCWTLQYADSAKFHLDILPCIVDSGYRILLEKAFSQEELIEADRLALRITDMETDNYDTERNHLQWLKSNPFGYSRWFFQRASNGLYKRLTESIQPVPEFTEERGTLQRVVQILKRHRDILFGNDEHRPISIIITTLAAKAYAGETNILTALRNVVNAMPGLIEERFSDEAGRKLKWVENPVNAEENFADKWFAHPLREQNFFKWMGRVQSDITRLESLQGISNINESLKKSFGDQLVSRTFQAIGSKRKELTEQGKTKINASTGLTATGGITVKPHQFYGTKEK